MEKENPYAAWIVKNEDKQGTKEFEEVKQSYMAERAKQIYESEKHRSGKWIQCRFSRYHWCSR